MGYEMQFIRNSKWVEAFVNAVDKGAPDECWEWQRSLQATGYGQIGRNINGKMVKFHAHRVSWVLKNKREIPEDALVCHTCDNRACVNPEHLFLGTYYDNAQDASLKGRLVKPGAKSPIKKLEPYDVIAVRLLSPNHSAKEIKEILNLDHDPKNIRNTIRGRSFPDENWDPDSRQYIGNPFDGTKYEISLP